MRKINTICLRFGHIKPTNLSHQNYQAMRKYLWFSRQH